MAYLSALNLDSLGDTADFQNGSTTQPLHVSISAEVEIKQFTGSSTQVSENGTFDTPLNIEVMPGPGETNGEPCEVALTSQVLAEASGVNGAQCEVSISESCVSGGQNIPVFAYDIAGSDISDSWPANQNDQVETRLAIPIGATFTLSATIKAVGTTTDDPFSGVGGIGELDISSSVTLPEIEPTPMSFGSDGGVDYGYQITGADLPQATTVDLYWASGTTTDREIGDPIATTATDTTQGTYPLEASASDLADRPPGAEYLLAVADPDNNVTPADPSKVADLALPDVTATDMSFGSDGGVNYGYQITGADLPRPTTVALFWASGTTTDTEIGDPIATTTTDTAQGTYPLQVSADLADRPKGAEYLLAVADPDDLISPDDPSKLASLALPDITPTALAFDASGGLNYGYTISNADLPQTTTVDLYWASGTTPGTEIGDPVVTTTTETAQGTTPLQTSRAALGDAPQGATYLLAVADPSNAIAAGDSADVEVVELPDLSVSDLAYDAQGDVTFDAEAQDAEPPASAAVDLFWSSTESLAGALGSPIFNTTLASALGVPDAITVPASLLSNSPDGARFLVAAIDPQDQEAKVDDPSEVAAIPLTDIQAVDFAWNPAGGATLSYKVIGSDLPEATDVTLWWATGPTRGTITETAGAREVTPTLSGTGTLPIPSSAFLAPPQGTNDLIAIINQTKAVELLSGDVVVPLGLAPALTAPKVAFVPNPGGALQKNLLYSVQVSVTNTAPVPLDFTMDDKELFPNLQVVPVVPSQAADDQGVDLGVVQAGDTPVFPLGSGTFTRTWTWIDPSDNLSDYDTLGDIWNKSWNGLYKDLASYIGSLFEGNIITPGTSKLLVGFADLAQKIIKNIDGPLNTIYSETITYAAQVQSPVQDNSPATQVSQDFTLDVPDELQTHYANYTIDKVSATSSISLALKAVQTMIVQPELIPELTGTAVGFMTAAAFLLDRAVDQYDDAVDPPDSNFTMIPTPAPVDLPAVDSLPAGAAKDLAETALQLQALETAADTARNRGDGARLAGDASWEARQLLASSTYSAQASALLSTFAGQFAKMEVALDAVPQTLGVDVDSYLVTNPFPAQVVQALEAFGISPGVVTNLRQNMAQLVPDQSEDPSSSYWAAWRPRPSSPRPSHPTTSRGRSPFRSGASASRLASQRPRNSRRLTPIIPGSRPTWPARRPPRRSTRTSPASRRTSIRLPQRRTTRRPSRRT